MEIITSNNSNVILTQESLDKLIKLAEAIEFCNIGIDSSIHVKFKSHVILETEGSFIRYSEKGSIIDKATMMHIQPNYETQQGTKSMMLIKEAKNKSIPNIVTTEE